MGQVPDLPKSSPFARHPKEMVSDPFRIVVDNMGKKGMFRSVLLDQLRQTMAEELIADSEKARNKKRALRTRT